MGDFMVIYGDLNGGFNEKIIYKWAIYTMAMLVITRW